MSQSKGYINRRCLFTFVPLVMLLFLVNMTNTLNSGTILHQEYFSRQNRALKRLHTLSRIYDNITVNNAHHSKRLC